MKAEVEMGQRQYLASSLVPQCIAHGSHLLARGWPAERQSSCFLGLGEGTVPNLSSSVVCWKASLSLSLFEKQCSGMSICQSVLYFPIFLNVEFCYCKAWLCLRIISRKSNSCFYRMVQHLKRTFFHLQPRTGCSACTMFAIVSEQVG